MKQFLRKKPLSREQQIAQSRRQPAMRPLPSPVRKLTVAVVPAGYFTAADELVLLAVLRELRHKHDALHLVYRTRRLEIADLLHKPWFLSRVERGGPNWGLGNADLQLVAEDPAPESARAAEQAEYDRAYAHEVQRVQAQQVAIERAGIRDMHLDPPVHAFRPQWNRAHGLLWSLQDELGLEVRIPAGPILPYGVLPGALARSVLADLERRALTRKPFGLFDFGPSDSETPSPHWTALTGSLHAEFPELAWLDVADGETPLSELIALSSHPNCRMVVGGMGPLLTAAQAVGQPYGVQLYEGSDPHWDGVQLREGSLFLKDEFPEEELPGVLAEALRSVRRRM